MPNKPTSKQISLGNGNTLNTVVYANGVVNATEIQVGGIPVINSDGYFVGTGGGGSGAQGATGAQGADGYVGSDGAQGAIGAQGIQGLSGIGIQGTAGAQGIQGLTGAADQDTIDGKRNRHGFPYDPDLGYEVTLSYSRANKQVTITPIGSSFNVWIHGVRNEFNTPLVSDAHANTTQTHYVYFDGVTGDLTTSATAWNILRDVPVCAVVYNADIGEETFALFELHTADRNLEVHYRLHFGDGTKIASKPGAPVFTNWTANVDTTDAVTWDASAVRILDEEIELQTGTITGNSPTAYRVLWKSNTSGGFITEVNSFADGKGVPFLTNGSVICWNQLSGGNWIKTPLTEGQHVNMFLCGTTDINQANRYFLVAGQRIHATLEDALNESPSTLTWAGAFPEELVVLGKFTYHHSESHSTNTHKAHLNAVEVVYNNYAVSTVTGQAGPVGPQGEVGVQGIQGVQGLHGQFAAQGVQGAAGAGTQGATGSQGSTGLQGFTGSQGTTGIQGAAGLQGTTGSQGSTGSQGTTGLQGLTGLQGTTGSQGASGSQGTTGLQGSTGTQGTTGIQGIQGTTGLQGLTGAGTQGATGLQGIQGVQGSIGTQGLTGSGTQGATGIQGLTGIQGTTGLQGTTGAGTQGATGSQGTTGIQGSTGLQGLTGAGTQGATGIQGSTGIQGIQGVQGSDGTGAQGATGIQGATGSISATGSNTEILFNNDGSVGANANLRFDFGNSTLYLGVGTTSPNTKLIMNVSSSDPAATAENTAALYFKSQAGRMMPAWVGPWGVDTTLQPFIGKNKVSLWNFIGGATTAPGVWGMGAPTFTGTATTRAVNATSLYHSFKRTGYLSAATANSNAAARLAVTTFLRGNTAGMGGFTATFRFGISDPAPVANAMMFIGFHPTTAQLANGLNVLTMQNVIGVGQVPSSNNLHIITNRTAATAATVDTGLRCNVGNTNMWDVTIFAAPNSDRVGFKIYDMINPANNYSTVVIDSGTNLPLGNTVLAIQEWRTNNGAAQAVGIDFVSTYIETDN